MNTSTNRRRVEKKKSKGGISALVIAMLIALSTIPIAKAQIFPLSTQQLPPGTYVVTPEGYWSVQAWVAAHPGKALPASVIVVPEQLQPTTIVKEKTKTKVVHEHEHHHKNKHHDGEGGVPPNSGTGSGSGGSGGGSSD